MKRKRLSGNHEPADAADAGRRSPNFQFDVFNLRFEILFCLFICILAPAQAQSIPDEFRIKRQEVFEFTEKPTVTREGNRFTVRFASKGFCDATVAIEEASGPSTGSGQARIVRHLVSGVLGSNAPAPFQKGSLRQSVVWDGKDDKGDYVADPAACTVRVSLGLRPRFERNLYWSPYKRVSEAAPLIAACEQGVVLCEGKGVDQVRLYDRQGTYLRTIYPFPADKLSQVKGLDWRDFPQGVRYPWKQSLYQQTLLTSGDNCNYYDLGGMSGRAAAAIAVHGPRLLLAGLKLNRLATDGSSGGMELAGGSTSFALPPFRTWVGDWTIRATPSSAAVSPDGKWLYLAGYAYRIPSHRDTLHGVARMAFDGAGDAEPFLGTLGVKDGLPLGAGDGPGQFRNATSVDCDGQGRVYVGDFMNDRVQVFSPEGKFLKQIKVLKPAVVRVDRKSGQVWVFSWLVPSRLWQAAEPGILIEPMLTRFKSLDEPGPLAQAPLPLGKQPFGSNGKIDPWLGYSSALWYTAEVDFRADPVTVWIGNDSWAGGQRLWTGEDFWDRMGVRLLREKDGQWQVVRDFAAETRKEVTRGRPPSNAIQRLQVNPATGLLYVGEADSGPTTKAHNELLEIDPRTGRIRIVQLPFNAMEFVFDQGGTLYLRNTDMMARYDPATFREIPWDYGEERERLGDDGSIHGRSTKAIAALAMPSKSTVCYHQGGINVNARGHVIASCGTRFSGISGFKPGADVGALAASGKWTGGRMDYDALAAQGGKGYQPTVYPGRISSPTTPCIHVWDKHGKLIYEDAVPGIAQVDGVAIDRDDNIYVMHTPSRVLHGTKYINQVSETLMKVRPRQARVISKTSGNPVPLTPELAPKRPPDLYAGGVGEGWVENAEWLYGGVGFAGFNAGHAPSCACWFSRFALDYFARSIAPEPQLFSVAVLDTNGNLILRIGRYGNVDDGVPLLRPQDGPRAASGSSRAPGDAPVPPATRALGGDEVALFHACYVGTHTDRRIFISDVGNARIVSVRLDYHASESVPLK